MAKNKKKGGKPQLKALAANSSKHTKPPEKPPPEVFSASNKSLGQKRRRRPNRNKENQQESIGQVSPKPDKMPGLIHKYGMVESRRRLEQRGFHPKVTTQTLKEVQDEWRERMMRDAIRPSPKVFWKKGHGLDPTATRGFLIKGNALFEDVSGGDEAVSNDDSATLESILRHPQIGPQTLKTIFESGRTATMNLALASPNLWDIVTSNVKIWSTTSSALIHDGLPDVFVAVAPDYTVGEILKFRSDYPHDFELMQLGVLDINHPEKWKDNAIRYEQTVTYKANRYKRAYENAVKTDPSLAFAGPAIYADWVLPSTYMYLKRMRHIEPVLGTTWMGSQTFKDHPRQMPFQFSIRESVYNVQKMMIKISEQPNTLSILQFHKVPMFDRRLLAIILRACPNVQMIGVYDCPLITFGDVLCILDLIHEINVTRRLEGQPEIRSFDFYPHFYEGMRYQHQDSATYGITWGPHARDPVQRGFFQIILEAFLKAKAMSINVLFDKGGSFLDFLHRVPNTPFAVPGFLDAIYRYLELDEESEDFESDKKQAIYDLLKPVRMGLERVSQDWHHWYIHQMGRHQVFCASCGYETFQDFFTPTIRQGPPHRRICSKCLLQDYMDQEDGHRAVMKSLILRNLFRDWRPREFNLDAPILKEGQGLMHLRTTNSIRPRPPGMVETAGGYLAAPHYQEPMVRGERIPQNSLQNLPSLFDLLDDNNAVSAAGWSRAKRHGFNFDIIGGATAEYNWQKHGDDTNPNRSDPFPILPQTDEMKFQDHPLEIQPAKPTDCLASMDNRDALYVWREMEKRGW
ncbi:hypothetical protein PT974_06232 [Cladobotryum mycophilum]|uniref:Uncharacterized protein n=1 Tax=Cladobotryum mycophilum TaxID=491253 RepID=A0ABR0SL00_9HYPO